MGHDGNNQKRGIKNNMPIPIYFKKLYPDSKLPERKNPEDTGFDCFIHHFCFWNPKTKEIVHDYCQSKVWIETMILAPHQTVGCALGIASEIPNGYYVNLLPRSGLAFKQGIMTIIGTIDAGYRNEWIAIVHNLGNRELEIYNEDHGQKIKTGDKICQMIVRKMEDIVIEEKTELNSSIRGLNGFGSSGK